MTFEINEADKSIAFKENTTIKEVLNICDRWKLELTKWKIKGYATQ